MAAEKNEFYFSTVIGNLWDVSPSKTILYSSSLSSTIERLVSCRYGGSQSFSIGEFLTIVIVNGDVHHQNK